MRWWQRFRSRAVIRRFASGPPPQLDPGGNPDAIIRIQENLLASLRDERDATAVLDRARILSEHIDADRALVAEALFTVRGRARRHERIPFDSKTLEWLE